MDDVRAVMDAVGSERATLCGISEGGVMCALFAATYPARTSGLIMIGSYSRLKPAPEYPWGRSLEIQQRFLDTLQREWGGPVGLDVRAPSLAHDERFRQWWARFLRMSASPGAIDALTRMNYEIDTRHILPAIRVPTLLLHAKGDMGSMCTPVATWPSRFPVQSTWSCPATTICPGAPTLSSRRSRNSSPVNVTGRSRIASWRRSSSLTSSARPTKQ